MPRLYLHPPSICVSVCDVCMCRSSAVSWEVSDSGALYTCGQDGEAFINPNSTIEGNIFRRVYNVEPIQLGYPSVEAIYLDE